VIDPGEPWHEWSSAALHEAARSSDFAINPIIFAEVCPKFLERAEVDAAFPSHIYRRDELPYDAAFVAAKAFLLYRRSGGARRSPLPDFYIGAHALVSGYGLVTRDAARYRTYFPSIDLIAPDQTRS
jgi:predicted nucleic acid-binding protein